MKLYPAATMVLASAVAATVYAQEAPAPAPATVQQAAPAEKSQAPTAAPAATATTPAQAKTLATTPAATTPVRLSPDILKKARRNGYHIRVRRGTPYFCKSEASIGTRFVDEKCMTEDMLESMLEKQQRQRDELNQSMDVCGSHGGVCGGS